MLRAHCSSGASPADWLVWIRLDQFGPAEYFALDRADDLLGMYRDRECECYPHVSKATDRCTVLDLYGHNRLHGC